MIGFKSILTDFAEKDGPTVVFSDNSERAVMIVGTFECSAFNLKDVFHVNGLKDNCISVNQLCDVIL